VRCCLPFLLLALGCTATRQGVPPLPAGGLHPEYRIGCPDVLDVSFTATPSQDVLAAVDVDGRLPLPGVGRPRVEGLTAVEAGAMIAHLAEVPPEQIVVAVSEPRAARVAITGPDNRRTRWLAYPGPVSVLDFLRSNSTLPPAATNLNRVYVLRSNVAAGTPPRLYYVDVEAVLLDADNGTNMPLEPGDHVYVGETRRSSLSRLVPDFARPLYRRVMGLLPESLR